MDDEPFEYEEMQGEESDESSDEISEESEDEFEVDEEGEWVKKDDTEDAVIPPETTNDADDATVSKYFGLSKPDPGPPPEGTTKNAWIRQTLFPHMKNIKDRPANMPSKHHPQSTAEFVELDLG